MPRRKLTDSERLVRARQLWFAGGRETDIARMLDVHVTTFRKHRKAHGWPPRAGRGLRAAAAAAPPVVPGTDQTATAVPEPVHPPLAASEPAPRSPDAFLDTIGRLLEAELAALGALRGTDSRSRALAQLVRTLASVKTLRGSKDGAKTSTHDADDNDIDIAEFRRDLARRLARLHSPGDDA